MINMGSQSPKIGSEWFAALNGLYLHCCGYDSKDGNKCNRVKGHGIIYPNDVIKKLIYNIKNVRFA